MTDPRQLHLFAPRNNPHHDDASDRHMNATLDRLIAKYEAQKLDMSNPMNNPASDAASDKFISETMERVLKELREAGGLPPGHPSPPPAPGTPSLPPPPGRSGDD